MPRGAANKPATSYLRIIGGQWRGRKVAFQPVEGLRPTPDRVRETLFNWLAADIPGARCADLFAGSGALGLEALSRGAAHCTFIDEKASVISTINSALSRLDAQDLADTRTGAANAFCSEKAEPFHLVFIDPPFGLGLVEPCCQLLQDNALLAPAAAVYVEMGVREHSPEVPPDWALTREKHAGDVCYRLYRSE